MNSEKILEVHNLKTVFKSRDYRVEAVRGVDFSVEKGDILGIVGESGSGKSVTMKSVLGILPENADISADKILFNNKNLIEIDAESYRKLRGKEMTMIFQDPLTALNPLLKIGKQLEEVILRHNKISKREAKKYAIEMLTKVGITAPEERLRQYPHEFSGGMRQRVLIAMALSCNPQLLIADEPTTALDVTIQAQILDLLKELQDEYKTSIVLITHDMGVVATICNKIAIMYGGMIMEKGTVDEIFYRPKHPYTKALLKAIPSLDLKEGERLQSIPGRPPSLINPKKCCPFAERCKIAQKKCFEDIPTYKKHSDSHYSMCFFTGDSQNE